MFPFMSLTLPLRKKVVVDNDVDENLQKESSNDNQKDASHGNQDE